MEFPSSHYLSSYIPTTLPLISTEDPNFFLNILIVDLFVTLLNSFTYSSFVKVFSIVKRLQSLQYVLISLCVIINIIFYTITTRREPCGYKFI